jgi:hypothetical protein
MRFSLSGLPRAAAAALNSVTTFDAGAGFLMHLVADDAL